MSTSPVQFLREAWALYRFVASHPLTSGNLRPALLRTARWQIGSRILGTPAVVNWVDGSRLVVSGGRSGLTGNVYTGLHEYADMAFVLHYLRSNDLFLDIGANVGSYTVLAAAVCGANALSVEPVPSTFKDLRDNVRINDCEERCRLANVALSDEEGELQFTADLDAMNHVAQPGETTREIFSCPVRRLDDLVGETAPNFMKLDVEGYESKVLDGAPRTLEKLQAIIIELNGGGSRYGVRDEEVASRLLRVGFLPHTYRPATRELVPTAQASTGGNTIFLRDPADAQARVRSGPERSVYGRTI